MIFSNFVYAVCLDDAGATSVFAETCTGTCYDDYVIGTPSIYDNAYFDIASVRVYGANGKNTTTTESSSGALPTLRTWKASAGIVLLATAFVFSGYLWGY